MLDIKDGDPQRNELSLFWKHSDLAENVKETRLNSCLRRGRLNHPKVNKLLLNKRIILAIILLSLDLSTLQNHLHFLLSSYKKNPPDSVSRVTFFCHSLAITDKDNFLTSISLYKVSTT